jgi:hypothetical protein
MHASKDQFAVSRRALALALLVPSLALASVVIAETWEEMAQGSTRIIRGRVALIEAVQDEASGIISTLVDMEVTEVLKGDPKVKTLRLKHLGGTVGGLTLEVPGSAHFTVGEDTLLFLEPARDPEIWLVRSMAAGKVNFEASDNGQMRARQHLDGLGFFEQTKGGSIQSRTGDLGDAEAFLARIRAAVGSR